jgi:tRNA A37 threonylcarbamoyladenosine synthetase subunit TsaC/SUA5/YrdC
VVWWSFPKFLSWPFRSPLFFVHAQSWSACDSYAAHIPDPLYLALDIFLSGPSTVLIFNKTIKWLRM